MHVKYNSKGGACGISEGTAGDVYSLGAGADGKIRRSRVMFGLPVPLHLTPPLAIYLTGGCIYVSNIGWYCSASTNQLNLYLSLSHWRNGSDKLRR